MATSELSLPPLTQSESEGESASSDAHEGQRASTQTEQNGSMQQPKTRVANVAESTLPPPPLISSPIPISAGINESVSPPDQLASISPSRSITSALAAVRSFKGTFFGPSTPPNLDSDGADKHASIPDGQPVSGAMNSGESSQRSATPQSTEADTLPSTKPHSPPPSSPSSLGVSPSSTTTSYFPSSASITSFFSSGSKPRTIPQGASTPPPTISNSAPASAPPLISPLSNSISKETDDLSSLTSTSFPASQQANSTSFPPASTSGADPAKSVPQPANASAFTAFVDAAAPYFRASMPTSSKPSKQPDSLQEGWPALPPQAQEGESSSEVRGTSANEAPAATSASSAEPEPGLSPSSAPLKSTLSPPSEGLPRGSPQGKPLSPSHQALPPGHSPKTSLPGTLVPATDPGSPVQNTETENSEPATSPEVNPPGTHPQASTAASSPQVSLPGTSEPANSPGPSSRATPPGTSAAASSSAASISPNSSYLSLPSFLPSWSTITAQLPSIPSPSFTSREQGPAVGSSAAKGHPTPPAALAPNPGGVIVTIPPASEFGRQAGPSPLSQQRDVLQSSELPGPYSRDAAATSGISPSVTPQSSSASPSGPAAAAVSEPGGGQRRELDPPGAAAAEAIAGGIAEIFGPVTREADQQVEAALRSQEKLALSIDRLTRGLDQLLEKTPQPLVAQQAARLAHIRKRVTSLASTLKVIQGRIDSMNWALDRKSSRVPIRRGRSATAPNSPHGFQALTEPFEQVRQYATGTWASTASDSGRAMSPLPTSWGPNSVSGSKQGTGAQSGAGESSSGQSAEMEEIVERPSSKSPEKGHRRAMSHDVRSITATFHNKR